ncbi:MAG: hypothetical protein FVQ79_08595 [Planctomycetes bacterium]|nr:hypothetical protein [Planctomycetota bacterium]
MSFLTAIIAAIASSLVCILSPVQALAVYIAVLAWYPVSLTLKLGTVDFSASRIVAIVLLSSLLMRSAAKKFKFIAIDWLVIIYFVSQIISGYLTSASLMQLMENRAGIIVDLTLPYFIVRMTISTKDEYMKLLKYLLFIALPLAFLGMYQSITGNNPVGPLLRYAAWGVLGDRVDMRYGLYRANVTFPVHIHFGMFFAMVGALCAGLIYNVRSHKKLYTTAVAMLSIGVVASVSSAPVMAVMLVGLFMILFYYRRYARSVFILIAIMCISVEIFSNRHFYDVIGSFAMNGQTAWYRSMLMEVALFQGGMDGHWLFGYGYETDPGWSSYIDLRGHTDIVNHYLLVLARFGLVSLIPFLAINFQAGKRLIHAFKITPFKGDKWMVWSLASIMVALSAVFFTVSLFGQPRTIYFMMLALCASMPVIVTKSVGTFNRMAKVERNILTQSQLSNSNVVVEDKTVWMSQ